MTGPGSLSMARFRAQGLSPKAAPMADQDKGALPPGYTHLLNEENPNGSEHPLAGFGVAVKANIAGQGWPTHCGSRLLENYRSPFDSTVVERLRAVGARFNGVTVMDEFGMGSSSENTVLGQVVNPWNDQRTAGGSSGGSAAAVAAGAAWYALGSDTGGSVRLPAHCCGLVGLKPTWGRLSRHGLVAFASSLDTIGILARYVSDAHEVFSVLAGPDPRDATSLRQPVDRAPLAPEDPWRGVRVGVPSQLADLDLSEAVRRDHQRSLELLKDLGARIRPVSLPGMIDAVSVYTILNSAEAASNLHRYDGSLYGVRQDGDSYGPMVNRTRTRGLGPEVKRRLLLGAHVLSGGYRQRYYWRARQARHELGQQFERAFADVKVLALPTAPTSAFPLGKLVQDPVAMRRSDVLTVPASLAGLPALTFPTDLDADGLPLSLQLVGPPCCERNLLEWAQALEKILAFQQRKEAPWNRQPSPFR